MSRPLGPGLLTLARGYRDWLAPVSTRNLSPRSLSEMKNTCVPGEAATGGSLLTSFLSTSTATCSCVRRGQTDCGRNTSLEQPSAGEPPLEADEGAISFGSSVASVWAGQVRQQRRLRHRAPRAAAELQRRWQPWQIVKRPLDRPPEGRRPA